MHMSLPVRLHTTNITVHHRMRFAGAAILTLLALVTMGRVTDAKKCRPAAPLRAPFGLDSWTLDTSDPFSPSPPHFLTCLFIWINMLSEHSRTFPE